MTYGFDDDILQVLTEAGSEGLSVRKVARHVFNARHTMFDELVYEDVHAYVAKFLLRSSKSKKSPIIRGEKRGMYLIDKSREKRVQLRLDFVG